MTDHVSEVVEGSFRDPAGFVFFRDGLPHRQVNAVHAEHWEKFLSSGLYDALVKHGLLVPHEDLGPDAAVTGDALTVIRPQPVNPITYPYEWCFSQLKDAALATLRIQEIALDHGMSLRDASAYNIQFVGGRPVLIDTLSFDSLVEGEPWIAYRQFCMHFLGPLALMAHIDVRLSGLLRNYIDGLPLDLVTTLLPRRVRMRPSLALHLSLHARSEKRYEAESALDELDKPAEKKRSGSFTLRSFKGLVESLRAAVRKLDWEPASSTWSAYYSEGDSYTEAGLAQKQELVAAYLEEINPDIVWDLGANTGMFSRIAAERGSRVVAFDGDIACIEGAYRTLRSEAETRVTPLFTDLTNPSPSLGWHHNERASLVERGPADAVLALALIHHLAIGNNVPLRRVAAFLADLTPRLVIEFVPKSDPKVRLLLASREDVFPDYTQEGFEAAFSEVFEVRRAEQITESDRVLYLMHRR